MAKVIRVTGSGCAKAPSTEATIDSAITNLQPSVSDASKLVSAASSAVHEKLLQMNGMAEQDVTTTNISIHIERNYGPNGQRGPPAYRVSQSLRVKLRAATGELVSQTVDTMVAAAGDTLEVHSVAFGMPEEVQQELTKTARVAACKDARAKAELLAESLGVGVGEVLEISDAPPPPGPPQLFGAAPAAMDMMVAEGSFGAPVTIGDSTVADSIYVTFGITPL